MDVRNATPQEIAAHLLRITGPEPFFTDSFAALKNSIIPKTFNLSRPLWGLQIRWAGRIVIGTAAYSVLAAEALQNIIARIRLTGTHRLFNSPVPIDLTGAWAFAYPRLFQQRGPSILINGARQAELSQPVSTPVATFGAVGTYDVEVNYVIPLVPMGVPAAHEAAFLYFADDWKDSLQLELDYGDLTSFGTPGGTTTVVFSALGSGTGSPSVVVETIYANLGILRNSIAPGLVIRGRQLNNTALTANGNSVKLFTLQKRKTNCVIQKTGTLLTGTSSGISIFSTLSDTLVDFSQILVDNKPIRNNQSNPMYKEYAGFQNNSVNPQGYLNFNFIDAMNAYTYFRADDPSVVGPGANFELDANVISGGTNEAVEMVQEQVLGEPQVVLG